MNSRSLVEEMLELEGIGGGGCGEGETTETYNNETTLPTLEKEI